MGATVRRDVSRGSEQRILPGRTADRAPVRHSDGPARRQRVRDVARPTFGGVEADDANWIAVLTV
jgi:hypothetical protein